MDVSLSDSDEESEIKDLEQLTAVLTDEPSKSEFISQSSAATSAISCSSLITEESKLETALALNKLTDEKLLRLEKNLVQRLRDCREQLEEVQKKVVFQKPTKSETFRYVHCGVPYFKDKNMFPAPDNEDTILIDNLEMFNFSFRPFNINWTINEKKLFLRYVLKLSKDMRIKELESKIAAIKRKAPSDDSEILKKKNSEYEKIKNEIASICKRRLIEVVYPIEKDYDWDLIANALDSKHSGLEHMSFWRLFLHPAINKSKWSEAEIQLLMKVAKKYKNQNWDCIAKDLNTSRTGLQCFMKFRSHLGARENSAKWTREEEEYLRRVIGFYKGDGYIPWNKVTAIMQNRTKSQIYTKYLRLYSKRTGRFLPEEDAVLLTGVNLFGKDFNRMMQYIPGRSALQLRIRYNVLDSPSSSITWTSEEDKRLIDLVEENKSKKAYSFSLIVKHFPGKNRIQLRSRYITLRTWQRRNPNCDISIAPRRGARELYHNCNTSNLSDAIERLRKRLEQEVEYKKSTALSVYSPEAEIDNAIIETLTMMKSMKFPKSNISDPDDFHLVDAPASNTNDNVRNLKSNLILLHAKLNKSKLLKTEYAKTYQGLIEEIKTTRVYSRKNTTSAKTPPDIWGGNTLASHDYVLPPNYNTIIGCRKLLSFVKYEPLKKAKVVYVGNFVKTQAAVSNQYTTLLYRLKFIFTWVFKLYKHLPNDKQTAGPSNDINMDVT